MRWSYTPADPLWVACQRMIYQQIVRRAAGNTPAFTDSAWLKDVVRDLALTYADFADDVAALVNGESPPRLIGEWDDVPQILEEQFDDDGFVEMKDD